ncbi:MAG: TonB-dependent receptor, partial [Lentisphaerae bacterium]|nr:TonB-dependent receptor [Lentisphaerota bacterium]
MTRRRYEPGFEGDASLQYGSYATLHALARHGGKIGDFDYYAVYDHKQTDGHRPNNQYSADFGFLRLGGQLNDIWRLEASGQYFADLGHDPGPENAPYTMNDRRIYRRGSWNAALSGDWLDARALLMAYNNFGEHKFNMPSIDDYWHSRDYTVGAKAEYSMTLLERGDLRAVPTVGYEYQYLWARPQDDWVDWARQNMPARFMDFDTQTQNNHDVYLFHELTWDAWVNTLGLRGHYDDIGEDWELLPHVGLLRHLGDSTTLRAKAARGFRQPRFSELHLFPAHNEDLQPEEVWGYDVGLRQDFGSLLSVEVTPFLQRVRNMIQAVPNADPPPQSVNRNSGAFDIRGVEVAAECRPAGSWQLSAAYTYTEIDDADGPNPNANRQGVPEHDLFFGAGYMVKKLRLHAEMRYIAGLYDANVLGGGPTEKLADYYVVNLRASYPVTRNAEIFGGIDN